MAVMVRTSTTAVSQTGSLQLQGGKVIVEAGYCPGDQTIRYLRFGDLKNITRTDLDAIKTLMDELKAWWPLS